MRHVAVALLGCFALCRAAETRQPSLPITVVLEFEHRDDAVPLSAIRTELQRLLADIHVPVALLLRNELTGDTDGDLVVFKMRGTCIGAPELPVEDSSGERRPLAMTFTTEGRVLPFGAVECDRIRQSLTRIGQVGASPFGTAIARVMAHEIYHMMGEKAHTKTGITKESLSSRELAHDALSLSAEAKAILRR